eukprot:PITA_11568
MIQETKVTSQEFQKLMKKQKSFEGIATDSIGASGGIGTIWNKGKWDLTNQKLNNWWVRTDLKNKTTNEEYTLLNIYAPNHYRDKALCWESVKKEVQECQRNKLVLGGDLNLIWNIEEKMGGKYLNDPSRAALEEIIEAQKLRDIPPCNGKFTWSNKRARTQNIKERLDRILIQESIATGFSSIKRNIVHATAFDHKPVVLILDRLENYGPIPFKYNKNWDSEDEFNKIIKDSCEFDVIGSPHFVWESKQNRQGEEEVRQKSRCLWLKAGDKNTSFFHNNLKLRRASSQIDKIQAEGKEIKEREEIKEATHRYFKTLLTLEDQPLDNTNFLQQVYSKISDQQNSELEKEVTEEEIREATWSMHLDKALGPDGFTIAFYKTHWDIIKKHFVRMVKNVLKKSKMGENTKASHMALIPKKPNPLSFDQFKPISLCNSSYKIITKILTNRLKKILPSLISENQGGFVPK